MPQEYQNPGEGSGEGLEFQFLTLTSAFISKFSIGPLTWIDVRVIR
jgi:hypothetical protein